MHSYTGSDLSSVVSEAMYKPVREMQVADAWCRVDGAWMPCAAGFANSVRLKLSDIPPLQVDNKLQAYAQIRVRQTVLADFLDVLQHSQPSLRFDDIARHREFAALFDGSISKKENTHEGE